MPNKKYPSLVFKKRIKSIKNEFVELCEIALDTNRKAISLLETFDKKIAEDLVEKSKEVDVLGYEIERKCIRFMAIEQPFASDLMYIESSIRVVSHIKRITYLSANIGESAEHVKDIKIPKKVLDDLQFMADYVQIMLSKGISCFVNQDVSMAKELSIDDDKVDDLFDLILKQTTDILSQKTDYAFGIINVIFIARFLERIADRVVSIGGRTIFINTHKRPDIEHLKEEV